MKRTIQAVFHKGILKPLTPPPFREGERVHLTVETASVPKGEDLLVLAAEVYSGLTLGQIDEVERIALNRRAFFPRGKKR